MIKAMNLETLDVKPSFGSIVKMKRVTRFLNKVGEKIEQRTFCFSEAFPGADESLKRFFAEKEQREVHPEPEHVTFGQYAKRWLQDVLPRFSPGKQDDYKKDIEYRLLPFFGKLPFSRITGVKLREFVDGLTWKNGRHKGKPLSPHRKRNTLIPLKAIWEDACDEYQWELRDPFRAAKKRIREDAGQRQKKEREIFLFVEWQQFLDKIDSFYRPVSEIMLMTGMIASEILGLRKADISAQYIHVRSSVVKGKEKGILKTQYRKQDIPITTAIRQRLMMAMSASTSEFVFTMKDGKPFDFGSYRKVVWNRALAAAGLTNKVPYSARHSLAEWSLLIGVNTAGGKEYNPADDRKQTRYNFLLHEHVSGNQNANESNNVVESVAYQLVDKYIVDRIQDVCVCRCGECNSTRCDEGQKGSENRGFFVNTHRHLFLFLSFCG